MKTVVQEIIQWTIENAFAADLQGKTYIVVDHVEMRTKFDEWLKKDKQQSIAYHIGAMEVGLKEEGEEKWTKDYTPIIKKLATQHYDETFNEKIY